MRLVDADALKNNEPHYDEEGYRVFYESEIDNAPTVEYPFYKEAYQTGYEEGQNERPQGKKIKKKPYGWVYCSECDSLLGQQDKFCWNCGAKMQK